MGGARNIRTVIILKTDRQARTGATKVTVIILKISGMTDRHTALLMYVLVHDKSKNDIIIIISKRNQ